MDAFRATAPTVALVAGGVEVTVPQSPTVNCVRVISPASNTFMPTFNVNRSASGDMRMGLGEVLYIKLLPGDVAHIMPGITGGTSNIWYTPGLWEST